MKEPLYLLRLQSIPIVEQLRIEEALLRADCRNWCLTNHGSPPAIVMGISAKPQEVIDWDHVDMAPVPIIRRFSGGGTVVIDEHSFFVTFIGSIPFAGVSPFPHAIMQWSETFYRPLFHQGGFSELFALKENDYVLGNRKFGGNAQSITRNRWLHHSSLLWNYSSSMMRYLKFPKRRPEYRALRSHDEFLCTLSEGWSSLEGFEKDFINHLHDQFAVHIPSIAEISAILDIPHRKSTQLYNRHNRLLSKLGLA